MQNQGYLLYQKNFFLINLQKLNKFGGGNEKQLYKRKIYVSFL